MRFPAKRALWLGGVGLLTPELRQRFGARWGVADEQAFRALGAVARGLGPVMPERLRVMGPAQLRMRRRAIERGPLGAAA